jgi:hypothetical protein
MGRQRVSLARSRWRAWSQLEGREVQSSHAEPVPFRDQVGGAVAITVDDEGHVGSTLGKLPGDARVRAVQVLVKAQHMLQDLDARRNGVGLHAPTPRACHELLVREQLAEVTASLQLLRYGDERRNVADATQRYKDDVHGVILHVITRWTLP